MTDDAIYATLFRRLLTEEYWALWNRPPGADGRVVPHFTIEVRNVELTADESTALRQFRADLTSIR